MLSECKKCCSTGLLPAHENKNPQLRTEQLHCFFASTFLWQNMLLLMKWLETSIPLFITTNITTLKLMSIYNTQIFCGIRSKVLWFQRYLQTVSYRVFSNINCLWLHNSCLKCQQNVIVGIRQKNCNTDLEKL